MSLERKTPVTSDGSTMIRPATSPYNKVLILDGAGFAEAFNFRPWSIRNPPSGPGRPSADTSFEMRTLLYVHCLVLLYRNFSSGRRTEALFFRCASSYPAGMLCAVCTSDLLFVVSVLRLYEQYFQPHIIFRSFRRCSLLVVVVSWCNTSINHLVLALPVGRSVWSFGNHQRAFQRRSVDCEVFKKGSCLCLTSSSSRDISSDIES
jgi:hypothetical protein